MDEILPAGRDITVQVAHLAGAGTYDELSVDEVLSELIEGLQDRRPGTAHLIFDVATIAGADANVPIENAGLIAKRLRQIGMDRLYFGSDAAVGSNLAPREAWFRFRQLPLTDTEFAAIAGNIAPYLS
jgi:hypothetical protein